MDTLSTDMAMVPVPHPADDDAPLPSRHLSRLSETSQTSELSTHAVSATHGAGQGSSHRMQLAELVNMLLTDTNELPAAHARQTSVQLSALQYASASARQTGTGEVEDRRQASAAPAHQRQASHAASRSAGAASSSQGFQPGDGRAGMSPAQSSTPHSGSVAAGAAGEASQLRQVGQSPFVDSFEDWSHAFAYKVPQDGATESASKAEQRAKWLVRPAAQHAFSGEQRPSPKQQRAGAQRRPSGTHQQTLSNASDGMRSFPSGSKLESDFLFGQDDVFSGSVEQAQQ